MRRFDDEDLTGAVFRECDLSRARLVGVVMHDAEIDGLMTNLVVNGVEVMPYVEAELDRRHPVRLLIRSDEPADLQEAWRQLRDDWATTAERIRSMPAGSEQHGVDGEWSEDRFVDDGDVIHRRRSVRRRRHGLHLVARLADVERARQVRRGIKYDPRPPV